MLFAFCWCPPVNAQFEAGIMAGGSVYGGDLGPSSIRDYARQMRLSYGAFVRYRVNPYIAFRGHYQDLDLFGEDDLSPSVDKQERNLHFYTDLDELALQVEIHPFRDDWPVSPYIMGGIAGYYFNPQAFYNGGFVELQPLGTEGQGLPGFEEKYSLTRIAVPIGGGLRFNFGQGMYFGLQASGRATFFDHLDDVGGLYVDETLLAANGPLAVELAFRGDEVPGSENSTAPSGSNRGGLANDFYYSITAHFSYQFPTKDKSTRGFKSKRRKVSCPKF
ncbi:MAG: DUF6089 family protein [Saprospiraceae bacterium]